LVAASSFMAAKVLRGGAATGVAGPRAASAIAFRRAPQPVPSVIPRAPERVRADVPRLRTAATVAFTVALLVGACGGSGGAGPSFAGTSGAPASPSATPSATATATLSSAGTATAPATATAPGTVVGTVLDTAGRPLGEAHIWVETQGLIATPGRATTGDDGRYRVDGLFDQFVYRAHAWAAVRYRDRDWCVQIAPSPATGSETFIGGDGAVRDFRWRLSGPVDGSGVAETEEGHWWGATIRIFTSYSDDDYSRKVELTLEPDGPLLDGSAGETVVRTVDPAASLFALDGSGSSSNGVERGFLDVVLP
jgi:hypothetical protein